MTRKEKVLELDRGYNVGVTGRHVQVTEAMKLYAVEKISKLERFGSRIIDVDVIMDIQKIDHRVDIIMKYGHTLIKAHGSSPDMYVSVDVAVNKLETQLKKYLQRIHDHHARVKGIDIIEVPETIYGQAFVDEASLEDLNEEIEAETVRREQRDSSPHRIIKQERQHLMLLTDQEAIMKMELAHLEVLVYHSEEDNKRLRVIYRRRDGNFGVIKPE